MGASKCLLLRRALIAINVALIVALVIKNCRFAEVMGLPSTIHVLFGLLSFDLAIYLAFQLLWPVRSTIDEKICSQVLLEKGHDYGVGIKDNPLIDATYTDHVGFELQDTNKALGTGLDPVLRSKCEANLQEQVIAVDKQDETFDIGEKPLSKISQDHLGPTVGREASISKALHVEPTKSFACHGSCFLSEHEDNARNLIAPCGQALTSKFYSTKNVLDNTDYLGINGFADREVVRNAISAALSQQIDTLVSVRCNEINDTLKFNNEYVSMNFGRVREFFSAHLQFADILDEFWGNLFDLHGRLTEKGKIIRLDLLIGLDVEDKIQSCPYCFDGTPGGQCDPFKLVNLSTVSIPPLFNIRNSVGSQHGNCTLPAVVELRRCIMQSFLKDDPSLLQDEKVPYFAWHMIKYIMKFPYMKFFTELINPLAW